jgi:hypothetical protein
MLESILLGLSFVNGAVALDAASTYFYVKKNGVEDERNILVREKMKKEGIGKTLRNRVIKDWVMLSTAGLLCYYTDFALENKDSIFNLHNAVFYGFGSIKYLAGISNSLFALNFKALLQF